jgi:putative ABC transport system ATP-binding protein
MTAALTLDHISHSVLEAGEEKRILALLNRRFEPGVLNVVGGPSGADKTTLLSILSLTVRATQGMILFGETNLTALSQAATRDWRRKNIGMVFQTSRLVSVMTVREHILLAARLRGVGAAIADGLARLQSFGLADKAGRPPRHIIRRRKSLAFSPAILLADEPTAALDQHNAERVAQTLRAYAREKQAVVICVSHDRALFDAADDILKLEKA